MPSVVWTAVFVLLVVELFVVAILTLPWPHRVRRFIAKKVCLLRLGPRLRVVAQWILFALIAALAESINTMARLQSREDKPAGSGHNSIDPRGSYIEVSMEKQRKFRSERNLYLAGFALTLLFVIKRIVELMEQTVELEEDRDHHKKRLTDIADVGGTNSEIGSATERPSISANLRQRSTATSKAT
jgi:hypothetical protein